VPHCRWQQLSCCCCGAASGVWHRWGCGQRRGSRCLGLALLWRPGFGHAWLSCRIGWQACVEPLLRRDSLSCVTLMLMLQLCSAFCMCLSVCFACGAMLWYYIVWVLQAWGCVV
jgi:hypothetical protein